MSLIRVYDGKAQCERMVEPVAVRGVWALHRTLCSGGMLHPTEYTVTHMPTGASVQKKIADLDSGQALLQRLPEQWAAHAGFGPAGANAAQNRKDGAEVEAAIAAWRKAHA